jgi:hypothetical protein
MKYIGNYADWIDSDWLPYILDTDGFPRPSGGNNPDVEEFRQAEKAGYSLDTTMWYIYEPHDFPFTVSSPIDTDKRFAFWFIKMKPGQFMPMHRDPVSSFKNNVERYWFPLQDYEQGHVFIYEDSLFTDYKAGDLFKYDNPNAIHGACNIGWSPRVIGCFSFFDKD